MQKRQSPEGMRALLERKDVEFLTFRALAEQSGVPMLTLQYWSRRLRIKDVNTAQPALRRVKITDHEPASAALIQVLLPSGHRLLVEPGFDPRHLVALLATLEKAC